MHRIECFGLNSLLSFELYMWHSSIISLDFFFGILCLSYFVFQARVLKRRSLRQSNENLASSCFNLGESPLEQGDFRL